MILRLDLDRPIHWREQKGGTPEDSFAPNRHPGIVFREMPQGVEVTWQGLTALVPWGNIRFAPYVAPTGPDVAKAKP